MKNMEETTGDHLDVSDGVNMDWNEVFCKKLFMYECKDIYFFKENINSHEFVRNIIEQ